MDKILTTWFMVSEWLKLYIKETNIGCCYETGTVVSHVSQSHEHQNMVLSGICSQFSLRIFLHKDSFLRLVVIRTLGHSALLIAKECYCSSSGLKLYSKLHQATLFLDCCLTFRFRPRSPLGSLHYIVTLAFSHSAFSVCVMGWNSSHNEWFWGPFVFLQQVKNF